MVVCIIYPEAGHRPFEGNVYERHDTPLDFRVAINTTIELPCDGPVAGSNIPLPYGRRTFVFVNPQCR